MLHRRLLAVVVCYNARYLCWTLAHIYLATSPIHRIGREHSSTTTTHVDFATRDTYVERRCIYTLLPAPILRIGIGESPPQSLGLMIQREILLLCVVVYIDYSKIGGSQPAFQKIAGTDRRIIYLTRKYIPEFKPVYPIIRPRSFPQHGEGGIRIGTPQVRLIPNWKINQIAYHFLARH